MIPSSVTISGYEVNYRDVVGNLVILPKIPRSWETVVEETQYQNYTLSKMLSEWIQATVCLEGRYCIHVENIPRTNKVGAQQGWRQRVYVSFESDNDAMSFVLLDGKKFISEK
jgi:hypothetical protein